MKNAADQREDSRRRTNPRVSWEAPVCPGYPGWRLTTKEHERVHLLMPADWLCEVDVNVLVIPKIELIYTQSLLDSELIWLHPCYFSLSLQDAGLKDQSEETEDWALISAIAIPSYPAHTCTKKLSNRFCLFLSVSLSVVSPVKNVEIWIWTGLNNFQNWQ